MNEFNIVSLEQLGSESLIVFEVNNVQTIIQKTSVGESVKSPIFELNFPNSIEQSKWIVILFINGQYDPYGNPDKRRRVYLQMINCEQDAIAIKLDVKFQLGGKYCCHRAQTFCFKDVKKRWIGTNVDEITRNDNSDTLLLSLHLKLSSDNAFKIPSSREFMIVNSLYTLTVNSCKK